MSHHGSSSADESALLKLVTSGVVTICFEAVGGGHYFEMLKILKQTSNDPYLAITKRMIANKGIVGLLDGFLPWGAMQALVKGSSFGFGQAAAHKMLRWLPEGTLSELQRTILSGGLGGFSQGIVMSPMLLLKTRVMTDSRFRSSGGFFATSLHSTKLGLELIQTEGGLKSLTKGMGIFSFKRFADWGTRYAFVVLVEEQIKSYEKKTKLTKKEEMASSLLGGTLSALVTVPIDVMVSTIQQANKKGQKVSVIQIYREQLQNGGIMGAFQLSTRGLVARVTHVALTTLMMKNVSSWLYSFLANTFQK